PDPGRPGRARRPDHRPPRRVTTGSHGTFAGFRSHPADRRTMESMRLGSRPKTSRRDLLRTVAIGAAAAPLAATAFAQGRSREGYGTPGCPLSQEAATAPVKPPFAPTGWKTVALDHIGFQVPEYQKEAAFYIALMGWKLRSDDGRQAVLDI